MSVDDTKLQTFLDSLAKTGVIADACGAAGVSRGAIKRRQETDPAFCEAFNEALADAADSLESEARRRAVEGVARTRYYGKGEDREAVTEIVYSDTLMIALLKANKPDKFADRSKLDVSNPDGTMRPLNPTEDAARIAALLAEAKRRRDAGEPPIPLDDPLFT